MLAVAVATLAMPAALAVLGTGVNRWPLRRPGSSAAWPQRAERMLRRPGVAALFVLLPLALLAAPAVALKTGPPNVANLPSGDSARKSYEAFERSRGAGWSTPYEVVFHANGPITTTQRLRALGRFQNRVAKLDGVEAVLGPAELLDRTAVLRQITRDVTSGQKQVKRLEGGLKRTRNGTGQLRNGLASGATGAGKLAAGLGQAAAGSQQLAQGATAAAPQTRRLADGVQQTKDGARQLTRRPGPGARRHRRSSRRTSMSCATRSSRPTGPRRASSTTPRLRRSLRCSRRCATSAASPTRRSPAIPPCSARRTTCSARSTQLGPLKTNLASYTTDLSANATASKDLARGVTRLSNALAQLAAGSGKLDDGIGQTAAGAAQLASGVDQLSAGTSTLERRALDAARTARTGTTAPRNWRASSAAPPPAPTRSAAR